MQAGKVVTATTSAATQFRTTIAQHAGVHLVLPGPPSLGQHIEALVRAITIISVENLAWELWLWNGSGFAASLTNPDLTKLAGFRSFLATDAKRIAGAGLYYYVLDDLAIPVRDEAKLAQLYLTLVNRSVAGKSADDAGAIRVELRLEPQLGV